jgi:hypothetical protein
MGNANSTTFKGIPSGEVMKMRKSFGSSYVCIEYTYKVEGNNYQCKGIIGSETKLDEFVKKLENERLEGFTWNAYCIGNDLHM